MPSGEFKVIPAIDIMDGRCVRLRRGDFNLRRDYAASPVAAAKRFIAAGFSRLHVVDLDGARAGVSSNFNVVADICRLGGCRVDVGGGIRTLEQVDRWLDAGARQVCMTTMAVRTPELLLTGIRRFGPERFVVAADTQGGRVALAGWTQASQTDLPDFISEMRMLGITHFMSTDVVRDGMLQGPAGNLYRCLLARFPDIHLVASGGISRISQVRGLRRLGLAGVVVGRALYEGVLDPVRLASEQVKGG